MPRSDEGDMVRFNFNRLENDCLSILAECARRPDEVQTYNNISEWTGIPIPTVRQIILWEEKNYQQHSMLYKVAVRFGYGYKVLRQRGKIIDVVYYGMTVPQRAVPYYEDNDLDE